jgi:MFS family permease
MSDTKDWLKSLLPFVVMCFGGFMALLDIQIVASSLQYIGGGLSAAQDEISWVQTAYLIAEIVVIPLSGWLTRVFSTRWLFAASAAGFTVTSMLCAFAWNIQSMIAFLAARHARRLDGSDHVHLVTLFLPGAAAGLFRCGGRDNCYYGPDTRSRDRRLDHR